MSTVAVVDVGSNAIRLLGGTITPMGELVKRRFERYALRLGTDVFQKGRFSRATVSALEAVFWDIAEEMERLGVSKYRAVGTSALRDSGNAAQVVRRLKRTTGVELEVISGREESALSRDALIRAIGGAPPRAVLIDLGGGSLELERPHPPLSFSIPFGTVRLLNQYPQFQGPMTREEVDETRASLRAALRREISSMGRVEVGVGTGGNLTVLSHYLTLSRTGLPLIDLPRLKELTYRLGPMTLEERMRLFDLRADRADLAVAATMMVDLLVEELNLKTLIVPRSGLREELLFALVDEDPEQVEEEARGVAGRLRVPLREVRRRLRIARQLYRALWPVHRRYAIAERLLVHALFWSLREESALIDPSRLCSTPSTGRLSFTDGQWRVISGAAALSLEFERGKRRLWAKVNQHLSKSESATAELLGVVLQIATSVADKGTTRPIRLDMVGEPVRLNLMLREGRLEASLERRLSRVLKQKVVAC